MRSLTAAMTAALVLLPAAPAWAAPNQPPIAVDDTVSYRYGSGRDNQVDALANDTDPDGDTLTYTAVTPASKGNAFLSDGRLWYTPHVGSTGTDSFTYTVTDGQGNSASATVTATMWVDPAQPRNPAITSHAPGSVTLTWSAAAGATGYLIRRNDVVIDSTTDLSWTDTGLSDTATYEYRVVPVNGGGYEGPWASPLYRGAQPPAPTAPLVTGTDDPSTLLVTWDSGGIIGPWRVYRDGREVATTMAPRFQEAGLVAGREYSYQVQLVGSTPPGSLGLPSPLSSEVRGTPGVLSDIWQLVVDLGGTTGSLGPVTAPEHVVPGGRRQYHQNGVVFHQDGGSALAVMEPLAGRWMGAWSAHGFLGFPVTAQRTGLRAGGVAQYFEGGSIWDSPRTPPVIVYSVMEAGWAATGREEGPLGYPTSGDVPTAAMGLIQMFENGAVYWTAATGAHGVSGSIGNAWSTAGAERSRLGYPTSGERCGLHSDGCVQEFQGGAIHASRDTGVRTVFTPYLDTWGDHGWEDGRLGLPVADEVCGLARGGCAQVFQGGYIHWSPASGMHAVFTPYAQVWGRYGGESGRMGYPLGAEACGLPAGGCAQQFQGGYIHWSPASGMHAVFTPYAQVWGRYGGESGRMGYPLGAEVCGFPRGGCGQQFQDGVIYWSPASGMHAVFGGIRDAWGRQGAEWGRLGYPVSGETYSGGAFRQTFEGGTITISSAGVQITNR